MSARTDSLPAVAGVRVVHIVEGPIELAPPQRPDWESREPVWNAPLATEPLTITHRIGDVGTRGLEPVFEIPPWSTYYADAEGASSILFHSVDPVEPVRLMRSVRPGYEYVLEYEFAPRGQASRRGSELAAFAMALAIRDRGLMAHGSAIVLPSGIGALCLGVSGAGKSTLAKMMLDREDVMVLNDDRQVVSVEPHGLHLWSTPWPGSADIAFPGDAPLGAVVLIARGAHPTMRRVSPREALQRLLSTLAIPHWEGEALDGALALVSRMIQEVPVVELSYPLAPGTPEWILNQIAAVTSE